MTTANGRLTPADVEKLLAELLDTEAPPKRISLAKLHDSPFQPRRREDPEEYAIFKDNIRRYGQQEPGLVRPLPGSDGEFEILRGHRRKRALLDLERTYFRAHVIVLDDDVARLVAMNLDNTNRAALHPMDRAEQAQKFVDLGWTYEEIAPMLGWRMAISVSQYVALLRLAPDLQVLLGAPTPRDQRISVIVGNEIVRAESHDLQRVACDRIMKAQAKNAVDARLIVGDVLSGAGQSPVGGSRGRKAQTAAQALREFVVTRGVQVKDLVLGVKKRLEQHGKQLQPADWEDIRLEVAGLERQVANLKKLLPVQEQAAAS